MKMKRSRFLRVISLLLLCAMLAGCARTGKTEKTGKTGEQEKTGETGRTGQESGTAGSGTGESTETSETAEKGQSTEPAAAGENTETAGGTEPAGSAKTTGPAKTSTGSPAAEAASAEETAGESGSSFAADKAKPGAEEFSEPREEALTEQQKTEKMIREYIQTLSLEDKVSGLFIITPEALSGYDLVTEADGQVQESLEAYPVAGVVFFAQNIQSREQVQQMLALTKEWGSARLGEAVSLPPFLAVDEEGGIVARIGNSAIDVPYVGSMGGVGAAGDPEAAYEAGSTIGAYLQELGFNLDFAPDADVLIDPENVTIGERSFGTDPALCGQMVHRFVDGLHENGIASCIKHFPGLGDTESDTHTGSAWSSRTIEDYRGAEFLSFEGGIDAKTEMVMISHLSNSELSGSDTPASLNKTIITDILRGELAYDGIVITDSLRMGAVTERFGSAEAAVTAVEAGVDILLMSADFPAARQGILDAVRDGQISEERIDQSLFRILRVRATLK